MSKSSDLAIEAEQLMTEEETAEAEEQRRDNDDEGEYKETLKEVSKMNEKTKNKLLKARIIQLEARIKYTTKKGDVNCLKCGIPFPDEHYQKLCSDCVTV